MSRHHQYFLRLATAAFVIAGSNIAPVAYATDTLNTKPTIVLVHGAMEGASVWDQVIEKLQYNGFSVVAPADPLRSLGGDANYIAAVIKNIAGPVVLVGHSYGGAVISEAAAESDNVRSLVYVAGFAPAVGETSFGLVGQFPGSVLGAALAPPLTLADGAHDLSVRPDQFQAAFAADLSETDVALLAATQRPITDVALKDPADSAAWITIPSYFIYGSADMSIPPALHAFMAARAGAKDEIIVPGASHVVMMSHPDSVAGLIEEAANAADH